MLTRARSTSPGLRKSPSPLGLSVAQQCAQLAEQTAVSAMSRVGRIADETHCMHELVEATSAKARSVRGEVESRVATSAAKADTSASRAVEEIIGSVREVAVYLDT